jgi:DNA invertase Pin-like site-specific DNA recombinase
MPTTTRKVRVALYARCSTLDQKADLQLDALRQLAEQRGWTVVGEYVDLGVSGAKDRRPQLDEMLLQIRRGKITMVACWKLDRLARSLRHLIHMVDEFRTSNVDLVSVSDSIDTSTPSGRFALHVLGAVAELERELIRERCVAGIQAARRRGVHLGRPRLHFDVERAAELRASGMSFKEVAAILGVSVGKVHGALKGVQESSLEGPSAEA